jgi:hypothetical protein
LTHSRSLQLLLIRRSRSKTAEKTAANGLSYRCNKAVQPQSSSGLDRDAAATEQNAAYVTTLPDATTTEWIAYEDVGEEITAAENIAEIS